MAFLEWRRLNFFDLHKNVDGGKVAEALQDTTIKVCTSGNSQLVIGDANGWVRLVSQVWDVTSFKAYEIRISLAVQLRHDPCLVTIGDDEFGINPVIKVWDAARKDRQGKPLCVRISRAVPTHFNPTPATALAVHDNKNLMAVGFDDGSVILFRGDITRQRSSKMKTLPGTGSPAAITGLAFKGTGHLFAASRSSVMVFNIGSSGKEKVIHMDDNGKGCKPNCTILAEQQFVVAKTDAIYCYTTDGRGPCYFVQGEKKRLDWYRSYLVTISLDSKIPANVSNLITILDIQNKFIVFSMDLEEVEAVVIEWGVFYIIMKDKQVHRLDEKDLKTKLSILFKKNLYDVAIRIASNQQYDTEGLIDIYTQYADHLYMKGDPKGAIEQYIKTIGRLETSYVIRKYLDSRHLEPLTYYLQELHKKGLATEDHTTLLLTCFVKLDQHDQDGKLKEFINTKSRLLDFDVEIGIKVCRQVSVDDALYLANKNNQHDWYLRIMIEDKKDFLAALNYIADLEFDNADVYMKKYGHILIQHVPNESTQFLKVLCIDYKPINRPLVDDEMMAGVVTRNQADRAQPEEYIHLFLNNSECLVEFLEHLVNTENDWSTLIYNTLIEHYLHLWSSFDNRPVLKESYENAVVKLLKNPEANYDKDHTLIICQMLNFKAGILYLYGESKLYQQILRYHISQKDMESAMECCRRFGAQESHLWVEILWCPPPPQHLPEVLAEIANNRLLSPLLVIDCLSNSSSCCLGDVRKYLLGILSAESEVISTERGLADRYRAEAEKGRESLKEAATRPTICQASCCAACHRALDLHATHFLCMHSYHQHCFQSFSENEMECPACAPNNKKLLEVLQSQGATPKIIEDFHKQLETASDGFTVVAKYFGRGVFNKLTVITNEDSSKEPYPILQPDPILAIKPIITLPMKPILADVLNYGPGAEAKLRLEEGSSKLAPTHESTKPAVIKSSVIIPASEGRMRLMEKSQYSTSLEANVNHFSHLETRAPKQQPLGTTYMNTSSDFLDRNSKNSTPKKGSPLSFKSKKFADSASATSLSSSPKKKLVVEAGLNPFDDDSGVDQTYDEKKNPFAETESEEAINSADDKKLEDDYNQNLNPFA